MNMSDALDAGSILETEKNMRKIQARMKQLTRTTYQPDKDPQFFLFLNRLADAEEFKKTDRIDGRRALNDFIVDKDSIMYTQGVKKAEQVKNAHQAQLKESKFVTDNDSQSSHPLHFHYYRGPLERERR